MSDCARYFSSQRTTNTVSHFKVCESCCKVIASRAAKAGNSYTSNVIQLHNFIHATQKKGLNIILDFCDRLELP